MDRSLPHSDPSATGHRATQAALAAIIGVLVITLGYRTYGNRIGLRPTDHIRGIAAPVDLNRAEKAELVQLPDVGPALADAILTHRREHGRFTAVDDLSAVHGVGPKTLTKLRPWLTVSDTLRPSLPSVSTDVVVLERKPTTASLSPITASDKFRPGDPPLDVNAASEADLIRLPGVGPTLARRIIEARGLDRFKSPDDLRRVKGIGPKTLDGVRQYVVCR